jgi:hypothetical protein
MVEPFDGAAMLPEAPRGVEAWVQIHKLPPLFRNMEVLSQLASRVGKILAVETSPVQTRTGTFHRVRVKLDSTKPLTRFVPLAVEGSGRMLLQVKYEKMPKYCEHCGFMGHTYLECGTGEYEEAERQFGPWMLAEEAHWKPGTPGVRARFIARGGSDKRRGPASDRGGRTAGRGGPAAGRATGGRGRGKWVPKPSTAGRKRDSAEVDLSEPGEELDTASSPLKPVGEEGIGDTNCLARKHLDMDMAQTDDSEAGQKPEHGASTST